MHRALFALVVACATSSCRCGDGARPAPERTPSDAPSNAAARLDRNAIFVDGTSTPLPVSIDFSEDAPALAAPLIRLADDAHGGPASLEVAPDAPYGQLHRLMRAAVGVRIVTWSLSTAHAPPFDASITAGMPHGDCFVRAWIAPDRAVHVGMRDAAKDVVATVVRPNGGEVQSAKVVDVIRRLDATCADGEARLYTQPTASIGPLFEIARAIATASPKPHVARILFDRPSVGALDSPKEVVP